MTQRIEGGLCPVAGETRALQCIGTTESLSGYTVIAWECQVCSAIIHEPKQDAAPFGRHRRVNCPVECLDKGS